MSGVLARTTLKKAGGSLTMTVPAAARNLLGLSEGQEMKVSVEDGRVVAEPVRPTRVAAARHPKYSLDQLVAEHVAEPATERNADWQDEPPVGRELW